MGVGVNLCSKGDIDYGRVEYQLPSKNKRPFVFS